jgi:hypothetical protein
MVHEAALISGILKIWVKELGFSHIMMLPGGAVNKDRKNCL